MNFGRVFTLIADLEVVTVHFTREPIVETVITAREGAKLLVRNARGADDLDTYLVEAVEVVMFGGAVFYRSASRPSHFLVPVVEYEVVECHSSRPHLKKPSERVSRQNHRESSSSADSVASSATNKASSGQHGSSPSRNWGSSASQEFHASDVQPVNKPKRVRSSSSRGKSRCSPPSFPEEQKEAEVKETSSQNNEDVVDRASKILASLIPPPSTLVSESFGTNQRKSGHSSTSSQEPVRGRGGRSGAGRRVRFDRERRKESD
ncbi:hypothetical protein [Candidatus Similichlamydia epinepheli]|uniref:hypothetical protein n=1 Tax=Candidatus Similichlamydia epinepheli TaxID=1903953 RepID=UPI0013007B3F|nr:hypothetical protein [Candidatus Similichlamydia epinepheli]